MGLVGPLGQLTDTIGQMTHLMIEHTCSHNNWCIWSVPVRDRNINGHVPGLIVLVFSLLCELVCVKGVV